MTDWTRLIEETLASLPPPICARLANVQILTAETPSRQQRRLMNECDDCGLLGLYEGVPIPDRDEGLEPLIPDRITIFTRAHEEEFGSGDALAAGLRDTVIHEIGHFLGLDDEQLEELGL
jgi:predicted Zn-dependent protease with MMP-like domain